MPVTLSNRALSDIERILRKREKKAKASVSLSGEIIEAADTLAGAEGRSAFVERALRAYLRSIVRRARDERDITLINAKATMTNKESDRVLDLQSWPEDS